jgi:16S rRNA pseudouridine516 synthase
VVILLNKPVGVVCSRTDAHHPTVYSLLPPRFALRDPIIAPVGRLDVDTSGVLLLTDDGAFNHRLTSPRHHVAKTYVATLASDVREAELEPLRAGGLLLHGERDPLMPADVRVIDARSVEVVLREGRYHQVRRMFAAVGSHVDALERVRFGEWTLVGLAVGRWTVVSRRYHGTT